MVPFAGFLMPVQYPAGILAEHAQVRERAGLFDVSHMGQVTISGAPYADLAAAMEAITPGNIAGLGPGRMRYTVLLNDAGGIVDDLMVSRPADRDDALMLVVNAGRRAEDMALLRERLAAFSVVLHEDRALMALQGPSAAAVLGEVAPGNEGMAFMSAARFDLHGIPAVISRSGYTGEDGYEISVSDADAVKVAETLLADPRVGPIGLGARDSLRLEAGLCLYGHDMDETVSPVEAALDFVISPKRREAGGFPGADRILRELADGPSRLRVGLRLEGRAPAREGCTIHEPGGEQVGVVTSGGFGPTVGSAVAFGFVDPRVAAAGTPLEIEVRTRRLPATVADLPFVPQRYFRKKKDGGPAT